MTTLVAIKHAGGNFKTVVKVVNPSDQNVVMRQVELNTNEEFAEYVHFAQGIMITESKNPVEVAEEPQPAEEAQPVTASTQGA